MLFKLRYSRWSSNGSVTLKRLLWKISIQEFPPYNAKKAEVDLRLAGILGHNGHYLRKSLSEICAMFLVCKNHSTFRKVKGSNTFVWTAQGTFNFICSPFLQSLDLDFCSLYFGIMDVNMARLTAIGFIPEKIWL
jgi:hypothetical protein